MSRIQQQLLKLEQQHRLRQRRVVSGLDGSRLSINGKSLLNFADNDYLGLRQHPQVIRACAEAAQQYGVGSGASALISGYSDQHQALEQELEEFLGYQKVLLFSSGYLANQAVMGSLCQRGDNIFSDQLNHASLIDGCRLSRATVYRYSHSNSLKLVGLLQQHATGKSAANAGQENFILSDGVFSMDGDVAAYAELQQLAERYNASLIIDDAHGVGVMGEYGRGSWEAVNAAKPDVLIGTLGKAFGTQGAYVAASSERIEWLVQKGRSYVYTTALAPPIAAATRASLRLICEGRKLRQQLSKNIAYFRQQAITLGLELLPSASPIQPLMLGSEQRLLDWAEKLQGAGILVGAIRPPTVPEGTSRLRITFNAIHQQAEIDQLLEALKEAA
ncbi:MAG: 8-amino-7-oxononanoate synthase [Xanthomonadales bacterium]|nr:8-amino-7-oxononanoate synthase [Xanthomonadales bacterium]